jgi:hypothetical protein
LFVIVLQGEDALVGTVGVGQELAERIGIFEGAGVEGLEPVAFIDGGDLGQDLALGGQVASAAVVETARSAGLGAGSVGHGARLKAEAARGKARARLGEGGDVHRRVP